MDKIIVSISSKKKTKAFIDCLVTGRLHRDRNVRDIISEIIMVFAKQMEHGAPLRDLLEKAAFAIAKGNFQKSKILMQRGLSFAAKHANTIALAGAGTLAGFAAAYKNKIEGIANNLADKVMSNEGVNNAISASVAPIRFLKDTVANFIGIVQIISAFTGRR